MKALIELIQQTDDIYASSGALTDKNMIDTTYDNHLMNAFVTVFIKEGSEINKVFDQLLDANDEKYRINNKALEYFMLHQSMLISEIQLPHNFPKIDDLFLVEENIRIVKEDIETIEYK